MTTLDYMKYMALTTVNGDVILQCMICFIKLSNNALILSFCNIIFKQNSLAIKTNLAFFKARNSL